MKRLIPIFVAVTALAVVGCGSSNSSSSSTTTKPTGQGSTPAASGGSAGGASALKISADASQLKFDTNKLSASAGKVTITMANPSSLSHNVSIKGSGVDQSGNTVGKGATSSVSANLKPGTYTFYCSVDGHEAAGMTGTLT